MQPPQEPTEPDEQIIQEFGRSLAEIEQALIDVKQRYEQVQSDRQRQVELQQRLNQVNKQSRRPPELTAELGRIKTELTALEDNLGLLAESCLFLPFFGGGLILSKVGFLEVFWQAVRFVGLGIVVGWILKSSVG